MLVDIVSKNGNLLLSIPLPGDGQPDDDELKFLDELGKWNAINGEAIHGTRPWRIFGEGPTQTGAGGAYTLERHTYVTGDIRFTQKGDALYAIALAWPGDGKLTVKSLGSNSPHYPKQIGKDRASRVQGRAEMESRCGRSEHSSSRAKAVRLRVCVQGQPGIKSEWTS